MTIQKNTFLLGAHISIAGGFYKAIERGESIGCTCIQIFTKSNRQWVARPITDEEAEHFKTRWHNSIIKFVVAHSSYLINLGATNDAIRDKSIRSLQEELMRCEQLSIPYLIIHPGSCGTMTEPDCLARIVDGLDEVLDAIPNVNILLETMAGQGSNVCYQFEHIAHIRNKSHFKNRIGVCFDTCHAFAAGYDFRTRSLYENLWQAFDQIIGLDHLKVIHINDSKKELGSRVDRHEHIGKGKLGEEAFQLLFNDPRFFGIPKILETPKETLSEDLKNMHAIYRLLSPETKKVLNIKIKELST